MSYTRVLCLNKNWRIDLTLLPFLDVFSVQRYNQKRRYKIVVQLVTKS